MERVDEAVPPWEALRGLYGGLRRWAVDKPPPEEAMRLAGEVVRRQDEERDGSLVHLSRCAGSGAHE